MEQTIYVCQNPETWGIEELTNVETVGPESNATVRGQVHREGVYNKKKIYKAGTWFTNLQDAHNHANKLLLAEIGQAKSRVEKLERRGFFEGTMMKLP